jgi:hypothetical protein
MLEKTEGSGGGEMCPDWEEYSGPEKKTDGEMKKGGL